MQKKSTSRRTIGVNPLDAVIPDLRSQSRDSQGREGLGRTGGETTPASAPAAEAHTRAPATAGGTKERLTIHVPIPLIDRVKNAVFWTPGLTLADLGARALEEYVTQLEKENGGPFEPRRHELKGGRPMR
jgi:hypothetical protein